MVPENFKFGGGAAATTLHPLVAAALLLAIALLLLLPRKYVLASFLAPVFLIPLGQVIVVGGVHLTAMRLLLPFAWLRAYLLHRSDETFPTVLNSIDKAVLAWSLFLSAAFVLLYLEQGAVINRIGAMCDQLGSYLLIRSLIRSQADTRRVIKLFAVLVAVFAVFMTYEHFAQQNLFGALGGVSTVPEMRGDVARAQGPFQHSLLAGTFAATLLPLFVWLWIDRRHRPTAALGMVGATVMTLASWCSTPVLAYAAAAFAMCLWCFRRRLRMFRWGLVITLISLHVVMKAPVWWLIARVSVTEGSSSYHRAWIVDQFIKHIGDWWLIGDRNFDQWGWRTWDLCNDYIPNGAQGGLITLACFIAILVFGFKAVGKARARLERQGRREWLPWLLGCALFAHVVAFFGISYFDQTRVAWFALLAMICAATGRSTVYRRAHFAREPSRVIPMRIGTALRQLP